MIKYIFLHYLLLFIFVVHFCCIINAAESKVPVFPLDVTQLRYRQGLDMKTLFDDCSAVAEIPQKYMGRLNNFNQQEVSIPVKGDNFGSPNMEVGVPYYAIGSFGYDHNIFKLIIYNKIGEADTPLLNVQLNSYDQDGNLVDALLLDSVFCYEDIVRFSDFVINADYTVNIDGNVLYRYEDDMVVKKKKRFNQVYLKEKYIIKNGRFKLISRVKRKME